MIAPGKVPPVNALLRIYERCFPDISFDKQFVRKVLRPDLVAYDADGVKYMFSLVHSPVLDALLLFDVCKHGAKGPGFKAVFEHHLRSSGLKPKRVFVTTASPKVASIYESVGFEKVRRVTAKMKSELYYHPGDTVMKLTAVRMLGVVAQSPGR
jgi:hypothetical protein